VLPHVQIGPLQLQTFGLLLALAFLASGALLHLRLKELGRPTDWAYEGLFFAAVGGLVGARVDYLLQNRGELSGGALEHVFSFTGLVFFGGLLGGAVAVLAWGRWRRIPWAELFDLGAPAMMLGQAIGRIGCQIAGDGDYGLPSDLPWAMAYPEGTVPTSETVHPTPIYETLLLGLGAFALWRLRGRFRPGTLFALYLLLAGAERLLVETIRRNEPVLGSLTLAQLISVAMIAAGTTFLAGRGLLSAQARGSPRSSVASSS
jgi:phosphatidylglycerol---prolipoprotein diacylglyceryl transferase